MNHIQGVKVLNTLTETHYTISGWVLFFGIIMAIMALFCTMSSLIELYHFNKTRQIQDKMGLIVSVSLSILLWLVTTGLLDNYFNRTTYTSTKYQITVDNTVKYNEFINTYDVVSQDGDVYIVSFKLANLIKK